MGFKSPVLIVSNTQERFESVEKAMRELYKVEAHHKNGGRTTFHFANARDQQGAAFFMESEGIIVLATRVYDMGDA